MGVRSRSRVDGAEFGLSIAGAAVSLTPPAIATGAMVAEIFVRTAAVVFTRDGTPPTATRGIQADVHDLIVLNSRDELERFQAIRVGSTTATLDVEYFTDLSG
jgi:hypothetical protein